MNNDTPKLTDEQLATMSLEELTEHIRELKRHLSVRLIWYGAMARRHQDEKDAYSQIIRDRRLAIDRYETECRLKMEAARND